MAVRCLHCGAHNADGADWCNQCYASLTVPVEPEPTADQEESTPMGSPTDGEPDLAEPKWSCPACEAPNPISEDRCSTCGTAMVTAFTPPPDRLDEAVIRRWTAIPGGGHAKAGAGPTGVAIFLVVLMALGFSIALIDTPATRVMGILILIVGLALWAVSVQDVLRHLRTGSAWILQPRVISGVAGAVIALLIVAVLLATRTTPT